MSESGGCCRFCLRVVITAGLTALFMWLSIRTSGPTCTVEDLYAPALNHSASATRNASINVHIRLKNTNKDKGIYYDAINLSFYLLPASPPSAAATNLSVANFTFPPFKQGHAKKAHRIVTVNGSRPLPPVNNTTAFFRVVLMTRVRYKILAWTTKRHDLSGRADVEVNDGKKVKKGGIEFKSGAPERGMRYRALLVGFLGISFPLFLVHV